nr:hypothetical protein [Microbacterium bovistercoris]
MNTSPADLIEALTHLDDLLDGDVRNALDEDVGRVMTDDELVAFTRVTESLGRRVDALRVTAPASSMTGPAPNSARNGSPPGPGA